MKCVQSLSEYYQMIQKAKDCHGCLATNNCLYPNAVDRYINLKRFYAEENGAGVIFYSDEEKYYQSYYYVSRSRDFTIAPKEKPVLIQNIYRQSKKRQDMADIENTFKKSGFVLKNRLRHAVFEGWSKREKFQKAAGLSERIMEKEGMRYMPVGGAQLREALEFVGTVREIPFYQIPYYTKEEYAEEAREGRLCCITDADGRIVAARHLTVNGKKTYGWVGVEEQYKNTYGMALFFLCRALDYIEKNGMKMCSWVDERNMASIQYHEHIGSVWTGHIEDEWLME